MNRAVDWLSRARRHNLPTSSKALSLTSPHTGKPKREGKMVADSVNSTDPVTVKFLCSYGGKILPRYTDRKLRYHGGITRVVSVHRSVSFAELKSKLSEMYGYPVSLRCQIPTEDLDALISVTSDEDLSNLFEEYERSSLMKIRSFLYPLRSAATKPPASVSSSLSSKSSSSSSSSSPRSPLPTKPPLPPPLSRRASVPMRKIPCYANYSTHRNPSRVYLIHNGNHWQ